jgi:hypothetical protein
MDNFDRGFEAVIGWITLLLIALSLLCSWTGIADELPPIPHGETRMLDGKKYECFETEQYRHITQYVTVIAPALNTQVHNLKLLLHQKNVEVSGLFSEVTLLEYKLDIQKLDLIAAQTELEDVKTQIDAYAKSRKRTTIVHYVIHGLGLVAVTSLGVAYGLERIE